MPRPGTSCPPVFDATTGAPIADTTGNAFPIDRVPPAVMMRRDVVVAGGIGFVLGVSLALGVLHMCSERKR